MGGAVSNGIYQDIRRMLQSLKLPRNIMGFDNHNLSHEIVRQLAVLVSFCPPLLVYFPTFVFFLNIKLHLSQPYLNIFTNFSTIILKPHMLGYNECV